MLTCFLPRFLIVAAITGWLPYSMIAMESEVLSHDQKDAPLDKPDEPSPVRDVEPALRALEETGAIMDKVLELEAREDGRWTEESERLRSKVASELSRLDLNALDLPDGSLMSEQELIESALQGLLQGDPHLTRNDIMEIAPVVEWRGGRARVTLSIRQPEERAEAFRRSASRLQVFMHPVNGAVLMILLDR